MPQHPAQLQDQGLAADRGEAAAQPGPESGLDPERRSRRHGQARQGRAAHDRQRRLATSVGGQLAAVTTHPDRPVAQVAGFLRARWTQENFFKYIRDEFGLDTPATYHLEEVDSDERVVHPDWPMDKQCGAPAAPAGAGEAGVGAGREAASQDPDHRPPHRGTTDGAPGGRSLRATW